MERVIDNDSQSKNKKANYVDVAKMVCCILIIGSHCLPLFENENLNYYYGQWLMRFCVPFFFLSTGFFFKRMDEKKRVTISS